ncbi:MAG: hypothetical protein QOD81_1298 [Solirubrobacteraceae bacterium]|jgi:hypothetical protein|nr:hypothetical protein [Solirubrobacteraceae bacterium]
MAATDARADFQRARRRGVAARACRRLRARRPGPNRPRDLGDVAALFWRPARLRSIPLEAIVGTVDATADFDADFRPTTDRVSSRWQRVARAHRDGRALPPVAVIERPDGYYVLDGRHRVSVARALGHRDIDAWTSPAPPGSHAHPPLSPTTPERAMTPLTHRLGLAVTRALRASHAHAERVHFHAGDHGRPYVCEDRRCSSPSLRVAPS